MKKFTKLFLSCALVSVVAAASASMAMAAEGDVALTGDLTNSVYNPTSNTITIASDDVPGIVPDTQATYLVVEGTDKVEAKIEGIDQATGVDFDKTGLKSNPTEATEKEYTVYVGYYKGTADSNEFTIVTGKLYAQGGETIDVVIGSTTLGTTLALNDASNVAKKFLQYDRTHPNEDLGYTSQELTIADANYTQTTYVVGSTTLGSAIALNDASNIAKKFLQYDRTHPNEDLAYTGQTITVEAPAAE